MGDLLLDELLDGGAHAERGDRDLLVALGRRPSRQVVEEQRRIAAERRIAGEEREVRVDRGGDRVIVAGAIVDVAAQAVGLAAGHQRRLGVGLQVHEAVDHLGAGALQVARPADVRGLVEARLELDQGGNRLARLRRLDQRIDDGRIVAGAIERLLDRDHVRVPRRLAQELTTTSKLS